MSELTITLSDQTARWVNWYARMTGRSTSQVIGEAVDRSLSPIAGEDFSTWSDEDVLAAASGSMPQAVADRLEELRDRQDEGSLTSADREELEAVLKLCRAENWRKALALAEATRRGLHQPSP